MYFSNISIQNYKNIIDMPVRFAPGVNVLIGDNGLGKTAVLEALTICISNYFNRIDGIAKKGINEPQIRLDTKLRGDATNQKTYFAPTAISGQIVTEAGVFECSVIRETATNASRTKYHGKELAQYGFELTNRQGAQLPVLAYFSTQRLFPARREDYNTPSRNKLNDTRCGYLGCLDNTLDIKALKAWCMKMEHIAFKKKSTVREYEAFKRTVSRFMKEMCDLTEEPTVEYSWTYEDMAYVEDGKELPINYLSAGYQSLLWTIMVIAFRIAQLNPDMDDQSNVTGIIIIDEVDMHLHPKWQKKVMVAFQKLFPHVQFIVSTHAPMVISSLKDAALIYVPEDQTVENLPSAYAFSADDTLEFRQGIPSMPNELIEQYKRFDDALNEEQYDLAKEIVYQMIAEFGEGSKQVQQAKLELDME